MSVTKLKSIQMRIIEDVKYFTPNNMIGYRAMAEQLRYIFMVDFKLVMNSAMVS